MTGTLDLNGPDDDELIDDDEEHAQLEMLEAELAQVRLASGSGATPGCSARSEHACRPACLQLAVLAFDPKRKKRCKSAAIAAQIRDKIGKLVGRKRTLEAQREAALAARTRRRRPRQDWAGESAWDAAALQLLSSVFKLPRFRPLQREVINCTMSGASCVCLLPSGGEHLSYVGEQVCCRNASLCSNPKPCSPVEVSTSDL